MAQTNHFLRFLTKKDKTILKQGNFFDWTDRDFLDRCFVLHALCFENISLSSKHLLCLMKQFHYIEKRTNVFLCLTAITLNNCNLTFDCIDLMFSSHQKPFNRTSFDFSKNPITLSDILVINKKYVHCRNFTFTVDVLCAPLTFSSTAKKILNHVKFKGFSNCRDDNHYQLQTLDDMLSVVNSLISENGHVFDGLTLSSCYFTQYHFILPLFWRLKFFFVDHCNFREYDFRTFFATKNDVLQHLGLIFCDLNFLISWDFENLLNCFQNLKSINLHRGGIEDIFLEELQKRIETNYQIIHIQPNVKGNDKYKLINKCLKRNQNLQKFVKRFCCLILHNYKYFGFPLDIMKIIARMIFETRFDSFWFRQYKKSKTNQRRQKKANKKEQTRKRNYLL